MCGDDVIPLRKNSTVWNVHSHRFPTENKTHRKLLENATPKEKIYAYRDATRNKKNNNNSCINSSVLKVKLEFTISAYISLDAENKRRVQSSFSTNHFPFSHYGLPSSTSTIQL